MGSQLLCACFLLWPSIIHCCLCSCSMGCLSLVSPSCVDSSVVSWAGSQATWVLVPAQPAPNPLSDSLPIPMCRFLCLETRGFFSSDMQPFRLALGWILRDSCLTQTLAAARTQLTIFLLLGRIVSGKKVKAPEKILPVYTGPHTLNCYSVQSYFPPQRSGFFCFFFLSHLSNSKGCFKELPELLYHFKQEQKNQSFAFRQRN